MGGGGGNRMPRGQPAGAWNGEKEKTLHNALPQLNPTTALRLSHVSVQKTCSQVWDLGSTGDQLALLRSMSSPAYHHPQDVHIHTHTHTQCL